MERTSAADWMRDVERSLETNTWTSPLYINGSGWEHDDCRQSAAVRLFQLIGPNTSSSALVYQNAVMNDTTSKAFFQAMSENTKLRAVTLRNLSSVRGDYFIPVSLFKMPKLESLRLMKVSLDEQGCRGLASMLRDSRTFHSLNLEAVELTPQGFTSILGAIIISRSIQTIRLDSLEWEKKDIKRFLLATSLNRSLRILSMERMQLDSWDAVEVANLLRKSKNLTGLSLRRNQLDAYAVQVLVDQGLLCNNTLKKLYLSNNPLGDEGATHISKLLKESSSLIELCLVQTKISEPGCLQIARALRFDNGLVCISMGGNFFDRCAKQVVESLQSNMTLTHVLERMPVILAKKQGDYDIWQEVDFYLRANKAGRRYLREDGLQREHMPIVWQNRSPDILFHFIRSSTTQVFPTVSSIKSTITASPRTFVPSRVPSYASVALGLTRCEPTG